MKTRIAPSPTGYVHIGTIRTALWNYYMARQSGGSFVIRIEDTDQKRFVDGALENLLEVMNRLGIEHDEGPFITESGIEERGDNGPYIQSKRNDVYGTYLKQMIEAGHAYPCFCTPERLETMREEQRATKQTPKYDRHCADLDAAEAEARVQNGESHVYRMRIPEGKTQFTDLIRGEISIDNSEVDDQVIMKSDGTPTYHFAVVIDDHLMEITHVVRGEEWISSTPKHVLLHTMLSFDLPQYAHVPLLLNPDKTKLSKRQGDVSAEDFLNKGYVPDALINFVSTLGFNPKGDQEIYTRQELIDLFDITKVNKGGAVMNIEKLDWMNGQYLKQMNADEFLALAQDWAKMDDMLKRAAIVEKGRISRLTELEDAIQPYKELPDYDADLLVWKKADAADAFAQLGHVLDWVESLSFEGAGEIEAAIKSQIENNGLQNGNVLWPLRIALSGRKQSAGPFDLLWVYGKEESTARIKAARQKLA